MSSLLYFQSELNRIVQEYIEGMKKLEMKDNTSFDMVTLNNGYKLEFRNFELDSLTVDIFDSIGIIVSSSFYVKKEDETIENLVSRIISKAYGVTHFISEVQREAEKHSYNLKKVEYDGR